MALNAFIISSESSFSASSFSNMSNEMLLSLSVSIVALLVVLILFTTEKRHSTEQRVTGSDIRIRSKQFMLGKTSLSQESKTSIMDRN